MARVDHEFRRQLDGYSLATAEIFYRMPDARDLLQTFIWQQYDLAPRFPELRKFLNFWTRELDGPDPFGAARPCHADPAGRVPLCRSRADDPLISYTAVTRG